MGLEQNARTYRGGYGLGTSLQSALQLEHTYVWWPAPVSSVMARHRNVRNMNFHDGRLVGLMGLAVGLLLCFVSVERDYDEVYGRSYEEDIMVSPDTEGELSIHCGIQPAVFPPLLVSSAQFMYHRDAHDSPSLMTYMQQSRQQPPAPSVKKLSSEQPFTRQGNG